MEDGHHARLIYGIGRDARSPEEPGIAHLILARVLSRPRSVP